MNNREIVDYILSNKLKEEDVIKEIEHYEDEISIAYLWNDGFHIWDDNGEISIIHFADEESSNCYYTYEVISSEKALEDIEKNNREEKIQRLKDELNRLERQEN